jgi:hypothetical protein
MKPIELNLKINRLTSETVFALTLPANVGGGIIEIEDYLDEDPENFSRELADKIRDRCPASESCGAKETQYLGRAGIDGFALYCSNENCPFQAAN